jgi:2-keto-4-pentenoate hydratase/2-oxohepta-3-ene-1,7-dioic acid hydratase in catechol pathway
VKQVLFDNRPISPSKVVCIGRNYVEHIEELGNKIPEQMVVFNKPNSAVTDTLHFFDASCRFEGEICFLIQNRRIAGIGFGLDLTKADIQNRLKSKGLPWERAKAFDGSAVLSPFVPFEGAVESLRMSLHIDGELRQHADYGLMMYKPDVMLREIGTFMSLEDGDIIMSGTPKGVGTYAVGQTFTGRVYADDTLLLEQTWRVTER